MGLLDHRVRRTLVRESIEKGIGIARGVAFNVESPLLTGDDIYLFSAAKNAGRSPRIPYARIVDREGRTRTAAAMKTVGREFGIAAAAGTVAAGDGYRVLRTLREGKSVLDLEVPIFSMADHPLRLGEEEKEITIPFSDIRNFTSLAEGLPPSRVVDMLNDSFTRMIRIVGRNEGLVDKPMGDSVMALFGAPIALGDDAFRAVCSGLEMQEAV